MILIDDKFNEEELKKAKDILEAAGISVTRIIKYEDNFASTRWSADDVDGIDALAHISDASKIEFMQFAENQVRNDMVERGWDSLNIIADIYLSDEYDISKELHDYDVFEVKNSGEEEYLNRFFKTTPQAVAGIYADGLEEKDWAFDEDDNMKYWYWLYDNKNNVSYRIQLFQ